MRNLFLFSAVLLLLGALFSQPIRFWFISNQAAFPIEYLTYVPAAYTPADDEKYFDLKKDVPGHDYVDLKFQSPDTYFRFIQTENSEAMNLYLNAVDLGSYYNKETLSLNGIPLSITYYRDGTRKFVWAKGNKRYEVITNDTDLNVDELEKIDGGLKVYRIDPLRPFKKGTDSFFAFIAGFTK